MASPDNPRIALLGFSIECNKFAPPATKAHFLARTYLEGGDLVREARGPTPDDAAGNAGIYCCDGCGRAVAAGWHCAGDD